MQVKAANCLIASVILDLQSSQSVNLEDLWAARPEFCFILSLNGILHSEIVVAPIK